MLTWLHRLLRRSTERNPVARRPVVEEIEPRILYSADANPLLWAGEEPNATAIVGAVEGGERRERIHQVDAQQQQRRREIVFVDAAVPNAQALIDDVLASRVDGAQIEVVQIAAGADGLRQIGAVLDDESGLDAVHIVSHGGPGRMQLGDTTLDGAALLARGDELNRWRDALTAHADILLYGCDVAANDAGLRLIGELSRLTGADVAASDDATGHQSLGGDWELEAAVGRIDAGVGFSAALQAQWNGLLLSAPMLDATKSPALDTISEDAGAPIGPVGTLVSALVDFTLPSAQVDNVFDLDVGAELGIAVTAADAANGSWWYSADGGSNWNVLGAVDTTNARLLNADASTRLYFQPNADYNGTLASAITFRAWDRTSGSNGDFADTTLNGGVTAFSSATDTASLIVTPVNDAPAITSNGGGATASVNAAENQTAVATVTSGDVDGGAATYTINGGADAARFAIDSASGVLTFVVAPDFEVPTDANDDNVYDVTVQVSDGALTDSQAIAVTVSAVNDNAPVITSNGGGASASVNVAENSTAVTTVSAADADLPAPSLTYSIAGGVDAARFTINAATGLLAFNSAPNFESPADVGRNNVYDVTVQVSDGTLTDSQTLAVTVSAVNDAPVNTVPGAQSTDEDTALVFSAGNGNRISIGDEDAGGNTVEVTLTATHGAITLNFPDGPGSAAGSVFRVNTTTAGIQQTTIESNQAVALAPNGNFVVVWTGQDADATGVYLRLFDTNGTALSGDIRVNTTTADDQQHGSVAVDADGNFVVVWTSEGQDGDNNNATNIYARRFDAAATALSGEFLVNTTTFQRQNTPAVAMNGNGDFVVVWSTDNGPTQGVFAQRFNASGAAVGAELQLAVVANDQQDRPRASIHDDGSFIAVWTDTDDSDAGIFARRFDASGAALGAEFRVNTTTAFNQIEASVAIDAFGNFVVAWSSENQETDSSNNANVYFQRYDANGTAQGGEVRANTTTVGDQRHPSIAMDGMGNTLVAWTGFGQEGDSGGQGNIYRQAFDATGTVVGGQMRINTTSAGDQRIPAGAMNVYGDAVIVWSGNGPGDASGVFAQLYENPHALTFSVGDGFNDATMTFRGTIVDINAALDGMFFAPTANFNGAAALQIVVRDLGNSGGGPLTDTDTVAITVNPVNDAPVITSNGRGPSAAISVAENGSAVTTVSASDVDHPASALAYAIVGGADAGRFSIDATTGVLRFVAAPDYEVPADANANNVYHVTVQVSDGTLTDTQAIAVTVTPVNDNTPVIVSNGGGATAALSVAENTTVVATVAATDADLPAQTLSYSIVGGADAARFAINSSTGALRFVVAQNYEAPADSGANNVYDVTVRVSDGTFADTQAIAVTVTDVNDAPVIMSNGGGASAGVSVVENSTAVTTVISGDADVPAQTLNYSIAGGADAARFTINAATGVLGFAAAPDFEAPADANADNVYDVVVQVSDGTLTDSQAIAVTVTAVNDNAPLITSNGGGATSSLGVSENNTAVTTVSASEFDLPAQTLTYSIGGGADAARFSINATTGVLTFNSAPDFESPADADSDNVYHVTVQVSDGTFSDSQAIMVTVSPVNDNLPVITSNGGGASAAVGVAENGTAVTIVTAGDADLPAQSLSYSIAGGADAARFTINAATGALGFVAAPDFEAPADDNADNVYEVTVQVSDGTLTDSQAIAVTVTAVNENPVINSNGGGVSASVNVTENSTAVTIVAGTDADLPAQTLTYSIVGGADAALFTIDAVTGALGFIVAPDYEAPADADTDNVYDVTVQVSDGSLTDSQTIAVTVTAVNDNAPAITSNGGGASASVNVAENSAAVTTFSAADADLPAPGLTYSIAGGVDAALFTIDAATGALSFVAAPDFEAPIDVGGNNVYDVTVQVSDGSLTDSQAIAVTVTAVNDNAPVVTSNGGGTTATVIVAESGTAVTTVTATDADLPAQTLGYSITGGADAALFAINATTGALSFVAAPDHEAPSDAGGNNVYDVTVQVSDGNGGVATQAIAVTVTNVNEAPVITSDGGAATASASAWENQTSVTTVTSSDVDGGAAVYSIIGGADAARFAIDSGTGVLTFVVAPEFEVPADVNADNVYDVTVQVSDSSGGTDTQVIAVRVTNVNEAPAITSNGGGATASVTVAENQTAVTTVASSDIDGGAATYTISGGADAARFAIDSGTGVLSFVVAPDFEAPTDAGGNNVYDVTVQVSDGNGGVDTQAIAVTVTNGNEAPTITSDGDGAVAYVSAAENRTAITTVTSSDVDGGAATYAITGGADAARFAIDGATGALSFVVAPNFEAPIDTGADNVYDVTVQVSDGNGGTDTQAIAVTVTNVNEAPVITSNSAGATASVSAAENQTAVTTVASSDADGGAPTYSISGGADAARFTIDSTSGVLTFIVAPNFEVPSDSGADNVYDVTVQVADGNGGVDTQAIAVTMANVNEAPTITSNGGAATASVSVAESQFAVTTATSSDVDDGAPVYSIAGGADAARFAIDATTGVLSFVAAPNFEAPSDAGGDNDYDVIVVVSDGNGGSDTQAIEVTVTNVNEAPLITSGAAISAAENQTAVISVTSSDVDGGTPAFSIFGGADAARFAIDAATGTLAFVAAPDFEAPADADADNVYQLVVAVDDGQGGTDLQAIAVAVSGVNEAPLLDAPSAAGLVENAAAGTVVATVTASDPDAGDLFTFTLVDDGGGRFVLDAASVRVLVAPGAVFDFEAAPSHTLLLRVTDAQGLQLEQSIVVALLDRPAVAGDGRGPLKAAPLAPDPTPPAAPVPAPTPALALPPAAAPREPLAPATEAEAGTETSPRGGAEAVVRVDGAGLGALVDSAEGADVPEERARRAMPAPGRVGPTALGAAFAAADAVAMDWSEQWLDSQLAASGDPNAGDARGALFNLRGGAIEAEPGDGGSAAALRRPAQVLAAAAQDPVHVASAALSAGVVWWLTRTGGLLTSILMGIPAWRHVDLLPVLAARRDDNDDEDAAADDVDLALDDPSRLGDSRLPDNLVHDAAVDRLFSNSGRGAIDSRFMP